MSLTGQVLTQFSCSCQICLPPPRGERIPIQLVPLAARPAAPHMVLHLMSFPSLQACGIFQTILPWGPDVIPPSRYCKASLLEPLLLHSATYVALHGMCCPPPGCECSGPVNCCQYHLFCPVSHIRSSLEPWGKTLSLPSRLREDEQNNSMSLFFFIGG